MAAMAVKMEPWSVQSEPKDVQRPQREPEGSQKDVKRGTTKMHPNTDARKKGTSFPVLRQILGAILGAILHQKRIKSLI